TMGWAVSEAISVLPTESVLLIKDRVPPILMEWWGADQLPPALKIYPFQGFSLSKDGDKLYIWSNSAEVREEAIDSVSFAAMTQGVSVQFDTNECFFGCDSALGEGGAFRSRGCGDLGSPGYTTNPPARFVSIDHDASGATLKWRAVPGKTYQLEYNSDMPENADGWNSLGTVTAVDTLPTMRDSGLANSSQRFYRVRQVTP